MKKITKIELKMAIRNFILIAVGTFLLAFGCEIFLAQSKLVTGGMSGIAIILDELIQHDVSNYELLITIETWFFFILGFLFLGKNFALKTLVSAILYPIMIYLCSILVDSNFLYLETFYESSYKDLLASAFGGAFVGLGIAVSFLGGGSTGGTDIIALLLNKLFKKSKESTMIFVVDALIVLIALFIIKDFTLSLLGVLSAFICAMVTDKVFLGNKKSFVAQIITSKYNEITEDVIMKLDRTTTIFDVTGGYSKGEKKLVLVSFKMNEYTSLMDIIKNHDPYAFTLVSQTHEIKGEGWTYPAENSEREKN